MKDTVPWTYVSNGLNGEEIIGKRTQKINQQEFRIEKVIKKKSDMSNAKVMIIHLIAGLIKKIYCDLLYKNESIFSKTV